MTNWKLCTISWISEPGSWEDFPSGTPTLRRGGPQACWGDDCRKTVGRASELHVHPHIYCSGQTQRFPASFFQAAEGDPAAPRLRTSPVPGLGAQAPTFLFCLLSCPTPPSPHVLLTVNNRQFPDGLGSLPQTCFCPCSWGSSCPEHPSGPSQHPPCLLTSWVKSKLLTLLENLL